MRTRRELSGKQRIENSQRRIEYRLRDIRWSPQPQPMFKARNIQYEIAQRDCGLAYGGIGLIHRMVGKIELAKAIDEKLELLKLHLPYHESDHVLNIAYNSILDGTCLEDIELRRNDEVFLDTLGAQRIPDPTTAGDFCRRFDEPAIDALCRPRSTRHGGASGVPNPSSFSTKRSSTRMARWSRPPGSVRKAWTSPTPA